MSFLCTTFATLLCLAPASAVLAQYTAGPITFKNPGPYAQADLEATAGVHQGQAFSTESLQAAAQKLSSTGLFDDVQVALDGPASGKRITFTLKPLPPEQLLPTAFDNFIWWEPADLLNELHARVPLFNPATALVAETGEEQAALETALQAMLAARSITAHPTHEVRDPSLAQPRRTVGYRIQDPAIRLHAFSFTGVSPSQAPTVRKFVPMLAGRAYLEGSSPESDTTRVLNLYRNAGYLEASFSDVHRSIVSATPSQIDVDLSGTLHEGEVFHVARLDWAGSPVYSAADLNSAAKLHPGDVASRYMLMPTLTPLERAYHAQGYLDAGIDTAPVLDSTAHTVAYTISVKAGEQYHLQTVTVTNLNPAQTADFDSFWKLKPGDLYNSDYVTTFLTAANSPQSLRGFSASSSISADPATHRVDLTLNFVKGGDLITR